MSNLLPKKEKKALKTEYNIRKFSLVFFLISVILAISLILLFPSYILSRVRATGVSLDLESVKKSVGAENPNEDIAIRLRDAKDKARALQVSEKTVSVYNLLQIFENKPVAIKLKDISYLNRTEEMTIAIQGRARTRESLTEFEKQLRSNINFSSVNLPISNFAKEKDIDFTMNIVVKNKAL